MVTHARRIFREVADPARRRILDLLRGRELTAGEIAGHFRGSRAGVSRNLARLRAAKLVASRCEGARRVYRLTPEPLQALEDWLVPYRVFWRNRLQELKRYTEKKR